VVDAFAISGMDPYLEALELWSEVHNRLIVAIADDLANHLSIKYRVAIESDHLSEWGRR